ncbi:hypothetical protein GW17_00040524 [Ensete ventricosum]|nr:hypothetical protein GW17_00040524 [Ensete ventricosum]
MSSPWSRSPSDPTATRALWSASRGMSSIWGRMRPSHPCPLCHHPISVSLDGKGVMVSSSFKKKPSLPDPPDGFFLFLRRNHPRPHARWFLFKRRVYRSVRPSILLDTPVSYHTEQSSEHRYGTKLKTLQESILRFIWPKTEMYLLIS